MYKTGDKFTLKIEKEAFAEVIGVFPGGQASKETIYRISFAGMIFSIEERLLEGVFQELKVRDALSEYTDKVVTKIEEKEIMPEVEPVIESTDPRFEPSEDDIALEEIETVKEDLTVETEDKKRGRPANKVKD